MPRKCVVCKDKNPYYNFKGEKTATHCKACSEPTMVNIKSKRCVVCEEKIPNFNKTTHNGLKINEAEFRKRMEKVVIIIKKYIKDEPVKEISIIQLFYDK